MLSLLKGHVNDAVAPFIFLVLFLVIVGAALWLTPRELDEVVDQMLLKWLDKKEAGHKGYYDGMLTEDPNAPKEERESEDGKAD